MIIKENMLMKKIINTFKYGDKKVKQSLFFAILAGLVTVTFVALALIMSNMLCFFVAIVAGFITISMVQTFMIAEGEHPTVVRQTSDIGTDEPMPEKKAKKEKVSKPKREKVKEKASEKLNFQKVTPQSVEDIEAEENVKPKKEKSKKEKVKKEKTKKEKIEREALISQDEIPSQEDSAPEVPENTANEIDDDQHEQGRKHKYKVITAETAASYTKRKIKKTLHKYKVIKDHRMVIVDRCDRLNIYQTPAYVWIQENQFHILLIEEEPRLLMIPIFRITEISHLKKQPADEEKDYSLFKKSTILTESFRPYLPDYNHSNKTTDLTSYKNLYGITQGIYFTNNSAKNLFDLLGVDFYVEDKVTTSNKVNIFFKDAYKANIKLRDNVLDANGYADSITRVLDDMAHSSISHAEFKDTLNLMIKNKLITDEYANHYMDVRNSLRG